MINNYEVSFYFRLMVEGEECAFQEVSGISKELTIDDVVFGGENRFEYQLPRVSTKANLVLKRSLVPTGSLLLNWCNASVDSDLSAAIQTKSIVLSLVNSNGNVSVEWTFHNAYPIKYRISAFKSDEDSIVIENVEFAYTYFEVKNMN